MRFALFALPVVLLMGAARPGEEVYTWTDTDGVAHYTNDANTIPEKYRDHAHTLDGQSINPPEAPKTTAAVDPQPGSEGKPGAAEESKPAEKPSARSGDSLEEFAPPPLAPDEAAALDEAGWRKRFRRNTERVRRAELALARDKEQFKRIDNQESFTVVDAYGRITTTGPSTALRMQISEDERQLNEAREEQYDLERMAAREAIPLEWRR